MDESQTQKLLQTLQRNIQSFHLALTAKENARASEKVSEILSASQEYVGPSVFVAASYTESTINFYKQIFDTVCV